MRIPKIVLSEPHASRARLDELLRGAQKGNTYCREELARQIVLRLWLIAQCRLRGYSTEQGEELIQNALLTFWERLDRIRDNPDLYAYIILRNKIGDLIRRPDQGLDVWYETLMIRIHTIKSKTHELAAGQLKEPLAVHGQRLDRGPGMPPHEGETDRSLTSRLDDVVLNGENLEDAIFNALSGEELVTILARGVQQLTSAFCQHLFRSLLDDDTSYKQIKQKFMKKGKTAGLFYVRVSNCRSDLLKLVGRDIEEWRVA